MNNTGPVPLPPSNIQWMDKKNKTKNLIGPIPNHNDSCARGLWQGMMVEVIYGVSTHQSQRPLEREIDAHVKAICRLLIGRHIFYYGISLFRTVTCFGRRRGLADIIGGISDGAMDLGKVWPTVGLFEDFARNCLSI